MGYTNKELIRTLKKRLAWYEEAINRNEKPYDYIRHDFDFPSGNVESWKGSVKELKNTIDMLKANIR